MKWGAIEAVKCEFCAHWKLLYWCEKCQYVFCRQCFGRHTQKCEIEKKDVDAEPGARVDKSNPPET